MSEPAECVYEFGEFQLDSANKALLRNGLHVSLTPKVFDTLRLLVENAGQLVEKDQFLRQLWPQTFVEESALAENISRLRRVLDDADSQRFIVTVPKRGYRFVVAVKRLATGEGAAEPGAPARASARFRPGPALLAVAVLLVSGLTYFYFRHSRMFSPPLAGPIHSLAVLPLENLTGDASQEYFVDGMTDALITDLAQIGALRVISRTSVMRYKGSRKSLSDIAGELGVDAIVEGTVARSGNRVRITSQLIYAKSDQHLWAQNYERDLTDVLTLQGEVAQAIADQVRAAVTPEQRSRMASPRPVNRDAYDLYLQGQHQWNRHTAAGSKKSIEFFQQAVDKDPSFALAYVGLAEAYNSSNILGALTPMQSFSKAEVAATTALRLDPLLAEAHTALGVEKARYEFDYLQAGQELRKAIELNPNSAKAHRYYSTAFLSSMKRHSEAIAEMKKAVELDPLSPAMNHFLALAYRYAGDLDRSAEQFRHVIEIDPNFGRCRLQFAALLAEMGAYEESIAEFEKGEMLEGTNPVKAVKHAAALRHAFQTGGAKGYWRGNLALGLQTVNEPDQYWFEWNDIAVAYTKLGDKNKAFESLEKAYQQRQGRPLGFINSDPGFKNLRGDPRFSDLLRRLGLPE